jgi:anaerobic selenocysteine-containing dehydrogenase
MAAEHDDLMFSWGHFYLTLNQKAIDPPGETASNAEIFRRLARTMGFSEPEFRKSDLELVEASINWAAPEVAGIDMDVLRSKGYARLNIGAPETRTPHKEGNFKTPSGKCEILLRNARNFVAPPFRQLYGEMQGAEPIPELPSYIAPHESPSSTPDQARRYPLNIIANKSHGFLNSQYANEAKKLRGQGDQFLLISPGDAKSRSINSGDPIRILNDHGAFEAVAQVSDDVTDGVVVGTLGYWRQANPAGTVNSIAAGRYGGMGHCPTYSDNLVEVQRLHVEPVSRKAIVGTTSHVD